MDIRARLHRLDERLNERWLGISTFEFHHQYDEARPDFRGYAPTFYRDWRIIRRHLTPRGSFIDYGAGLGRVTILAAHLPFDRVIGIELEADLVKRGNSNIRAARGKLKCPAELICQDATIFPIPKNASVLYFNNPFSGSVLNAVLENVRRSGVALQIICNVPDVHGLVQQMRGFPWLNVQSEFALRGGRKCVIFSTRKSSREQTCSRCSGRLEYREELGDRYLVCSKCGTITDRPRDDRSMQHAAPL